MAARSISRPTSSRRFGSPTNAVNMTEADSINLYRLATAGKKGSFTAKNAQVIKLKSAVYNPATDSVTLTPKKPFALTRPVQLVVVGVPPSGLQDSYGRLIDGGENATALLRRGGATITAVRYAFTNSPRLLLQPEVVDALLDHQGLRPIAVKHAARAARALRDDTTTNPRRVEREEAAPQLAQIRVESETPLHPWTHWAPSVDRFAVALGESPSSSTNFTYESSGLPSPGRRSEGSAERRKQSRSS
jgi:hypothetical protein